MTPTYTEKVAKQPAKTNLTPGEKAALYLMRKITQTTSEADTIRVMLRERMKAEKLIG